ncbi:MAG: aryl-sulfate sulfotransferase [Mycoplasmatales bacterium]
MWYIENGNSRKIDNFVNYSIPNIQKYGTSNLFKIQRIQEKRMKQEYEDNSSKYSIDNPYIKLNPYERNYLSAYIKIPTDNKVKYKYVVKGKTSDTDFSFSSDTYVKDPVIPVVSLYNHYNNNVEVTLEDKDGNKTTKNYKIKVDSEIDTEISKVDIKKINVEESNSILDQRFIMDSTGNGFDSNGDLRLKFHYNYANTFMKPVNNKFLTGFTDESYLPTKYYSKYVYQMNAMGKFNPDFLLKAPKNKGIHHDIIYSKDTNKIYALYSMKQGEKHYSEKEYGESGIAIYNADSLKLEKHFTLTDQIPVDMPAYQNSAPFDVHLNSIAYDNNRDEIIVNSRSFSKIFGLDPNTGEINWILGDPQSTPDSLKDKLLKQVGDEITYTYGEHSLYIRKSSNYQKYYDEGKLVITVFDNSNNEIDSNYGSVVYPFNTMKNGIHLSPNDVDNLNDEVNNSRLITYAIDFKTNTYETIDNIELNGNSPYVSNIFTLDDKYLVTYLGDSGEIQIFDFNDKEVTRINGLSIAYRAYIYDYSGVGQSLLEF